MVYKSIVIGKKNHITQEAAPTKHSDWSASHFEWERISTRNISMSNESVYSLKVKPRHLQEFCHDFIAFSNTGSGAAAGRMQTHTHIRDMVHIREQSFFL